MVKVIFILVMSILGIVLVILVGLSVQSQSGTAVGIVDGKLAVCPNKPNCVSSESNVPLTHSFSAIKLKHLNSSQPMLTLKKYLLSMGATLVVDEEYYIAVTFSSSILRFVDDLELRLDDENQLVHIRSDSRVGHSDNGVNLSRVLKLKKLIESGVH